MLWPYFKVALSTTSWRPCFDIRLDHQPNDRLIASGNLRCDIRDDIDLPGPESFDCWRDWHQS